LVVWQRRRLHRLKSKKGIYESTLAAVTSLTKQNERLYRQLAHLDDQSSRMGRITKELGSTYPNDDMEHVVDTLREYKAVHVQLKNLLHRQVQQQILRAVLPNEDKDYQLTPEECEQLYVDLQALRGVQVEEERLKALLEEGDGGSSLESVQKVLRQVTIDADHPGRTRVFTFEYYNIINNTKLDQRYE
jgi:hypothetical protein